MFVFYFKNIRFFIQKKEVFLENNFPDFSIFLKSKSILFAVILKVNFNQKDKKTCSMKVVFPEFQKPI